MRLTGKPKLKDMVIPWETLDRSSQFYSDNFHTNMKGDG